jgi:hypothetical protein
MKAEPRPLANYGRFANESFRQRSVRQRLESIRQRLGSTRQRLGSIRQRTVRHLWTAGILYFYIIISICGANCNLLVCKIL